MVAQAGAAPKISASDRMLLEPKTSETYTPKQLYDQLMRLDAPTPAGKAVVKISKYLNAGSTPGKDSNGGPGLIALNKGLKSVAKRSGGKWVLPVEIDASANNMSVGFQLEVDDWEIWRFFVGKASPREIRRVLFLAYAAGVTPSTTSGLQTYCDQQAGMDCSGFASVVYGYNLIGHDGYGASQYRTRGVERTTIDDFQAGDAIVWLTEGHIAVIDSVTGPLQQSPPLRCWVAESTAGHLTSAGPGVQYSEYAFERDTTNKARQYVCWRPKATGGYTKLSASHITVRGSP